MTPIALGLVAQVIQMLLSATTSLPSVIAAGQTAIGLLNSNTDPTPAEEATIRAALDEAHAALQQA